MEVDILKCIEWLEWLIRLIYHAKETKSETKTKRNNIQQEKKKKSSKEEKFISSHICESLNSSATSAVARVQQNNTEVWTGPNKQTDMKSNSDNFEIEKWTR